MKVKLEIKNRWTGKVIFEFETENNTISKTVNEYVRIARANLTDADLTRANLTDADLTRANLTRANLTDADLLRFKSDLWRVLLMNRLEVSGLKKALIEGRIDGTKYEGECACLKGTIANVKECLIEKIPGMVKNVNEPSEQWFLQIKKGDNLENSNVIKKTVEWIEEFELLISDNIKETE